MLRMHNVTQFSKGVRLLGGFLPRNDDEKEVALTCIDVSIDPAPLHQGRIRKENMEISC
jgi:hypothetical protein